ncbi:unnamed protein product [Amoebophrya sp. A120]|nr:unnamed protein product [Amoebophrya sp. A120]|eukprot:GSA120T00023385001.1
MTSETATPPSPCGTSSPREDEEPILTPGDKNFVPTRRPGEEPERKNNVFFVYGPMFAGKSSLLIQCALALEEQQRPVLVIRPSEDTRYGDDRLRAHPKIKDPSFLKAQAQIYREKAYNDRRFVNGKLVVDKGRVSEGSEPDFLAKALQNITTPPPRRTGTTRADLTGLPSLGEEALRLADQHRQSLPCLRLSKLEGLAQLIQKASKNGGSNIRTRPTRSGPKVLFPPASKRRKVDETDLGAGEDFYRDGRAESQQLSPAPVVNRTATPVVLSGGCSREDLASGFINVSGILPNGVSSTFIDGHGPEPDHEMSTDIRTSKPVLLIDELHLFEDSHSEAGIAHLLRAAEQHALAIVVFGLEIGFTGAMPCAKLLMEAEHQDVQFLHLQGVCPHCIAFERAEVVVPARSSNSGSSGLLPASDGSFPQAGGGVSSGTTNRSTNCYTEQREDKDQSHTMDGGGRHHEHQSTPCSRRSTTSSPPALPTTIAIPTRKFSFEDRVGGAEKYRSVCDVHYAQYLARKLPGVDYRDLFPKDNRAAIRDWRVREKTDWRERDLRFESHLVEKLLAL